MNFNIFIFVVLHMAFMVSVFRLIQKAQYLDYYADFATCDKREASKICIFTVKPEHNS